MVSIKDQAMSQVRINADIGVSKSLKTNTLLGM